jgi:hypothetical protein
MPWFGCWPEDGLLTGVEIDEIGTRCRRQRRQLPAA